MRIFEFAFWALATLVCLWQAYHRRVDLPTRIAVILAVSSCLLHLTFEGSRWHLTSAYVVVFYFLLWTFSPIAFPTGAATSVLGLGLMAAAAVMGTLLPVFQLPAPTGPYFVGTTTVHLVDP